MARRKTDDDITRDDRSPEQREDDDILKEAKERLNRSLTWEATFRSNFENDIRFVHADPDNHAQWPDEVYNQRTSDTNRRPTMTANVVQNFAHHIINQTRQAMPSIAIKPTGDESTFKSSQIYEALVRHIQYQSQANAIYIDAHSHQVWGGVGYFRLVSRWSEENPDDDPGAWDQSLYLDPVRNHLGVVLDPDGKQKSASDAKWGFVFEDISRDQWKRDYPKIDPPAHNPLDQTDDWVREDTIRVAEYYRIVADPDELVYIEQDGVQSIFRMSTAPDNMARALRDAEKSGATVKRRKVWNKRLQWFKIGGNKIVDRNLKLPGKGNYIPIIRALGRQSIIAGRLDRKGVVRPLKDSQRLFNYYLSTDAEFNALQPKSPYIGYKESFEGNEMLWNKLNISNPAYLPVNMINDEIDGPIPLPQRQQPATDAPAFRNGMQAALQHMSLIAGLPEANQGQVTNERSGLALRERRRGGDTANYDFADNLAEAVCHAGRIMLEWIPDVYDTPRVIKVMGKDGTQSEITLQPEQKEALILERAGEVERALFNPAVGKYEVQADVGPAYATQREEAWDAFNAIVTRSPELMNIFGDLMFYTADFPLADKIAERMREQIRNQAPWLLGEGPPPMVQKMDQTIKMLQGLNQQLMETIAEQKRKLEDQDKDIAIKAAKVGVDQQNAGSREQDAISKRITAVTNAQLDLDREGKDKHFTELLDHTMDMAGRTEFDREAFGQ